MPPDPIQSLFDSGFRVSFILAGGGSGAIHSLLSTPGASRFVAQVRIPYSKESLEEFLGETVTQSCSPDTALKLARTEFNLHTPAPGTLCIACTAALQTDRERKGDDRAFICIKSESSELLFALFLSKTSRREQESVLSRWLMHLTATACRTEPLLILPGSFNPVHRGHIRLLAAAEHLTGCRGLFELSCTNVDKPPLDECECLRRAAAIRDIPVALTSAARFARKATLFPGATFALGHDTADRLLRATDPADWTLFREQGIRFLVAGREQNGVFLPADGLSLPPEAAGLFTPVPESLFRDDLSSTALRNGQAPAREPAEALHRTERLVGPAVRRRLAETRVILFGVGGVGSWCAEALVRSGIGRLTLVDPDVVCTTNINRQLQATTRTVGLPKVSVLRDRLLEIRPEAAIEALPLAYNLNTRELFQFDSFDYVIDAIDSLSPKIDLIASAMESSATLFSSMGAARKLDATQIRIGSIWHTRGCRLARFVRKRLRNRSVHGDCLCVYSPENTRAPDEPTPRAADEEESRINGTLAHITGTFGFHLAGLVLQDVVRRTATSS